MGVGNKELHLKIKSHFGKQLVKFIFKKGHVIESHHPCLCSQQFCEGEEMLGHMAKGDDGFWLLGYCGELFKDLELSAGEKLDVNMVKDIDT